MRQSIRVDRSFKVILNKNNIFFFLFQNKDFKRELEEREKLAYRQAQKDKARKEGKALDSPPPVKRKLSILI